MVLPASRSPEAKERHMFAMKDLKNIDRDDLLQLIGLETRRETTDWLLPAVGLFGAGLLIGAGLGLLLAPKSGKELRGDLRAQIRGAHEAPETVSDDAGH